MKRLLLTAILSILFMNSQGQLLEKDLTIGTKDDQIYFGLIQSIDVDFEGLIYVSDWNTKNIRTFSPKGVIQDTIGRKGRGPGEFQKMDGSGLNNKDQTVYAYDPSLIRVSIFDVGGSNNVLLQTLNIPKLETKTQYSSKPRDIFVYHQDQKFLLKYTTPYSPGTGDLERKERLVLFDERGRVLKQPLLTLRADQRLVRDQGGAISVGPMPFGRKSLVEIGPDDRIYIGWTESMNIKIYNQDGEYLKSISDKMNKIRVSDTDLEQKNKEVSSFDYSNLRNKIPDSWPAFDWFEVDDKNRVWVAVNTEDRQNYSVKIYNQKGKLLTSTILSKAVELREIRDGYAYGIQEGDNELQSVVRYKINFD